jgi:hypothetical protein
MIAPKRPIVTRHPAYISGMRLSLPLQLDPADSVARYQGGGLPKGWLMIIIGLMLYALPSMLAWTRQRQHRWRITAINLLLGWTVIGWIVALLMTYVYEPPPPGSEPDRPHIPGGGKGRGVGD